jgi:hypothetical protein
MYLSALRASSRSERQLSSYKFKFDQISAGGSLCKPPHHHSTRSKQERCPRRAMNKICFVFHNLSLSVRIVPNEARIWCAAHRGNRCRCLREIGHSAVVFMAFYMYRVSILLREAATRRRRARRPRARMCTLLSSSRCFLVAPICLCIPFPTYII